MFKLRKNMHSPSWASSWPAELARFFPTRIGERASANHAHCYTSYGHIEKPK